MRARRQYCDTSTAMRGKSCHRWITYLTKISFKNEGKLKIFQEELLREQTFSTRYVKKILKLWERTPSGKSDNMEEWRATDTEDTRGMDLRAGGPHGGGKAGQREWKGRTESCRWEWSREKNRPTWNACCARRKAKECSKSNVDKMGPPKSQLEARGERSSSTVSNDRHWL